MDPQRYSIRPFVDADYPAVAEIDLEIDPDFAPSAEESRRWDNLLASSPGTLNLRWVVEETSSGSVVAFGGISHALFMFHPQKFWATVQVRAAHRHRGIATTLYPLLEREAIARKALLLWASVRDDDATSVRFLGQQGFVPRRRNWHSRLDVGEAHLLEFPDRTRALADRGIRLTSVAEEGFTDSQVRQRLYRLQKAVSADVPRMGDHAPITFEQFVEVDLNRAGVLPDGFFLAASGDEYVGMTTLDVEEGRPDTLRVGLTGTRREFRGLGVASELKRRAVEYARAHDYRFMITVNDSLNAPMWAINEKLGFRKTVTWLQGEKALARPTA
jgi:GNAT superfamily N-acetyltransferase